MDARGAVLYDPACVALHGIRRSSFRVGDDVVVSGAGPVALGAIQFLKAGGARRLVLGTNSAKFPPQDSGRPFPVARTLRIYEKSAMAHRRASH